MKIIILVIFCFCFSLINCMKSRDKIIETDDTKFLLHDLKIENINYLKIKCKNKIYIKSDKIEVVEILNKIKESKSVFLKFGSHNSIRVYDFKDSVICTIIFDGHLFKINGAVFESSKEIFICN